MGGVSNSVIRALPSRPIGNRAGLWFFNWAINEVNRVVFPEACRPISPTFLLTMSRSLSVGGSRGELAGSAVAPR